MKVSTCSRVCKNNIYDSFFKFKYKLNVPSKTHKSYVPIVYIYSSKYACTLFLLFYFTVVMHISLNEILCLF